MDRLRVRTEIWVSAYLRRCEREGAFAAVLFRGEHSAGSIFIEVVHHGGVDLYAPAWSDGERVFERVVHCGNPASVMEKIERELRFDSDLWVVSVDERNGRSMLEPDELV